MEPFSRTLQKQEVYEELKHLTHGFTKLGPSYELEEQSLVVEGKCSRDDFVGTSATFVLITSEVPCFSTVPPFLLQVTLHSQQNRSPKDPVSVFME